MLTAWLNRTLTRSLDLLAINQNDMGSFMKTSNSIILISSPFKAFSEAASHAYQNIINRPAVRKSDGLWWVQYV